MYRSPQVAIVIVSYNTKALLLTSIASVVASTDPAEVELVVVDNASADGSFEAVRERYPQATAISNESNLGFGAACNQGICATTAPFILLLNSDAQLTTEAFQVLNGCMLKNDRCGAAGCRLTDAAGSEVINTRNFLTAFNQALESAGIRLRSRSLSRTRRPRLGDDLIDSSVDWIDGACLILRRAALEEVGLFDERFFMYSEDEDLCFRLRKPGWLVCFCANGTAVHNGAASSELNRAVMLRQFYVSQMLFLSKHRSRFSSLLYAATMKTLLLLKLLLLQDARRREQAREQLTALKEARSWKACPRV